MSEPVWKWMEGHTIRGLDGRYIARIWRDGKRGWDMPAMARFHGGKAGGTWEIEGYGDTPDAAIADLRSKFRGAISERHDHERCDPHDETRRWLVGDRLIERAK